MYACVCVCVCDYSYYSYYIVDIYINRMRDNSVLIIVKVILSHTHTCSYTTVRMTIQFSYTRLRNTNSINTYGVISLLI